MADEDPAGIVPSEPPADALVKKFALLVTQFIDPKTLEIKGIALRSENYGGMGIGDIIYAVECWLEKVKETNKQQFKDGISFGNQGNKPK